jgi:hypothetical protein
MINIYNFIYQLKIRKAKVEVKENSGTSLASCLVDRPCWADWSTSKK